MKNTVLKYGTISGLIAAILMFTSVLIEKRTGLGSSSEVIGYVGMVLSFIPLFLGVRSYRQTEGQGYVTFWKALNVGILIIVISGVFYTVSWLIVYYRVTPDFADKYSAYTIAEIKASGKDLKDTLFVKQQMTQYKEMANNPFLLAAYTFPESLPMGIIMTLLCGVFLMKKRPVISDAVVVSDENQPDSSTNP